MNNSNKMNEVEAKRRASVYMSIQYLDLHETSSSNKKLLHNLNKKKQQQQQQQDVDNIGEPLEKCQKRLNRVKLRNLTANHRANDVIVLEKKEQILNAKFAYGSLDFALSGEKVDIYIKSVASTYEWKLYGSQTTDSNGKLRYKLAQSECLPEGMYQICMLVRCDHTFVEFYMRVVPNNTKVVVFSIDGSFAANISFTGTDPKVHAASVDVVRYWQERDYLLIYITARPDIQHYKVTNWLAQHNFPLGMVYFSDGLSRDPMRQKTETLKAIVKSNNLIIHAAYGSVKDIIIYSSLDVPSNRIFIIGKSKTKTSNQANVIFDLLYFELNFELIKF
jgi:membrane-associated phosphatidylinositol transfer protein